MDTLPQSDLLEAAFVGRSNVGKSSNPNPSPNFNPTPNPNPNPNPNSTLTLTLTGGQVVPGQHAAGAARRRLHLQDAW